jgi:hypothetical protein
MAEYRKLMEQAVKKGAVKDLTPSFLEWKEKNTKIVGKYVGAVSVKSGLSEGSYNQYLFDTDAGLIKFHLGAATDGEIAGQLVSGHIYVIEYLGKEKLKGGHTVNKFKVIEIDPTLAADRE